MQGRVQAFIRDLAVDAAVKVGEAKPGGYFAIDFNFVTLQSPKTPEEKSGRLHRKLNSMMSFLNGHPWMELDMKMFNFDIDEMAVPNLR